MSTLQHQILDGEGRPVAGREARVAVYLDGADGPKSGSYQRVAVVSAVSDALGKVSWELPKYPGRGTPTYVVTGIEDHPAVVRVPADVSTTTVAVSRIATLDQADTSAVDLVTEEELTARLSEVLASLKKSEAADAAPIPVTGVVAGAPGHFLPEGATPPADFDELVAAFSIMGGTATPPDLFTPWNTGQYVVLGNDRLAYWGLGSGGIGQWMPGMVGGPRF